MAMNTATVDAASTSGSSAQMSSTQFLRPHLLKLAAYTPIEPFEILSQRYGRKPEDIIKLDANENPYGPPPEVLKALAEMPFPHVYPDPESRTLRAALSKMHNIPIEHLLVRGARKLGVLGPVAEPGRSWPLACTAGATRAGLLAGMLAGSSTWNAMH